MELVENCNHPWRNSEAGKYLPEKEAVDRAICLLEADKAQTQRHACRLSKFLSFVIITLESAMLFRWQAFGLLVVTESRSVYFEEYYTHVRHEGDNPVVLSFFPVLRFCGRL